MRYKSYGTGMQVLLCDIDIKKIFFTYYFLKIYSRVFVIKWRYITVFDIIYSGI